MNNARENTKNRLKELNTRMLVCNIFSSVGAAGTLLKYLEMNSMDTVTIVDQNRFAVVLLATILCTTLGGYTTHLWNKQKQVWNTFYADHSPGNKRK